MSLDRKLLHFQSVIIKCLSIESVEYCYIIPIISQLADYWGDVKMAYLCKIMSKQVKQHLNFVIDIHFLLSLKRSRKERSVKHPIVFDTKLQTLLKRKELFAFQQTDELKPSSLISSKFFSLAVNQSRLLSMKEKKKLKEISCKQFFQDFQGHPEEGESAKKMYQQKIENFHLVNQNLHSFQLSPFHGPEDIQFPQRENISGNAMKSFLRDPNRSFQSLKKKQNEEKHLISDLQEIDHSFFQLLECINGNAFEGKQVDISFLYDLFPVSLSSKSLSYSGEDFFSTPLSCLPYFACYSRTTNRMENPICSSHVPKGKQELHRSGKLTNQSIREKIGNPLSAVLKKDSYFFLLQLLCDRKVWKAKQWYPFVSALSAKSNLDCEKIPQLSKSSLGQDPLFSKPTKIRKRDLPQIEDELSMLFNRLSQSEKKMSQLIPLLITN